MLRLSVARRQFRSRLPILLLLLGTLAFTRLFAQLPDDGMLRAELSMARGRLRNEQPDLTPTQLERLAQVRGYSNFLARSIEQAFQRGDLTNAERLLEKFPGKVDDLRSFGRPLLVSFDPGRDEAMLDLLLKYKVNLDAATSDGITALTQAITYGHYSHARRLVEAGASVTTTNRSGQTPLGALLERGLSTRPGSTDEQEQIDLLKLMLQHGSDAFTGPGSPDKPSVVENALNRQQSAFIYRVPPFNSSGLPAPPLLPGDLFLTNNPGPGRRTPSGDTALHLAALWERTNVVEFLLANGFSANQTNDDGLTPLQLIAGTGVRGPGQFSQNLVLTSYGQTLAPQRSASMRFGGSVPGVPPRQTNEANATDLLLKHSEVLDVFCAAGLGLTNELAVMLRTNRALLDERDSLGRTALHYAVFSQLPAAVPLLLAQKADPSAITVRKIRASPRGMGAAAGSSPLHLAALAGNASLIRELLKAGSAPGLQDQDGNLALHLAARVYDTNCLVPLIQPPLLGVTNRDGETPLLVAVKSGIAANVECLLKAGARPDIGLVSNTLLHVAATRNREVVEVLLRHKLKVDARDGEGHTPFQLAVQAMNWQVFNLLFTADADINATDRQGNTALHHLAQNQQDTVGHEAALPFWDNWKRETITGRRSLAQRTMQDLIRRKWVAAPPNPVWTNTSVTDWLLEHGAKPNLANRAGQTPLHLLCSKEWMRYTDNQVTNRVAALLKAGAHVDLRDASGLTPLHVAATNATPVVLAMLLRKVSDPDALRDQAGRTPLHLAVKTTTMNLDGDRERLLVLLTNRSSPNAQDLAGLTPLHLAADFLRSNMNYGNYAIMFSLLLTNGAQPNARDKTGQTPLHRMLSIGNYLHPGGTLDEALLTRGFDFAARDLAGNTPLHFWMSNVDNSCTACGQLCTTILTNKTLINLTNAAGDTLLHTAIRADRYYNVKTLMDAGADPTLRNRNGETALRLVASLHPGNSFEQIVRPTGADHGFFNSLFSRNRNSFDLWLAADPSLYSVTNSSGQTPLMTATQQGLTDFAERLISLGAPLDLESALRLGRMEDFRRLLPQAKGGIKAQWLFDAANRRSPEALRALLDAGGDPRAVDVAGISILFRARAGRMTDIAEWLKSKGAEETIFDSLQPGQAEQTQDVLKRDPSSVSATNGLGRTPLMQAVTRTNRELAGVLLAQGAKADARDREGMTALHFAAARNQVELGELLLKSGANPNTLSDRGLGPLHLAAAYGCTEFVELLLREGADVNLQPPVRVTATLGNSPLHWAAHRGYTNTVALLLSKGADLQSVNLQAQTPADVVTATARGMFMGFAAADMPPYGRSLLTSDASRAAMLKLLAK